MIVILYCADIQKTGAFYEAYGFRFRYEKHDDGPVHLFGVSLHCDKIELCPATEKHPAGTIRLALEDGPEDTAEVDPDGRVLIPVASE